MVKYRSYFISGMCFIACQKLQCLFLWWNVNLNSPTMNSSTKATRSTGKAHVRGVNINVEVKQLGRENLTEKKSKSWFNQRESNHHTLCALRWSRRITAWCFWMFLCNKDDKYLMTMHYIKCVGVVVAVINQSNSCWLTVRPAARPPAAQTGSEQPWPRGSPEIQTEPRFQTGRTVWTRGRISHKIILMWNHCLKKHFSGLKYNKKSSFY